MCGSRYMPKKKRDKKDADKGLILLVKSEKLFKNHNQFKVIHGGKSYPIVIKGIPCVRADHVKPHRYYSLKINFHELKPGDTVEITKDAEGGYFLDIKGFFEEKIHVNR